MKFKLTTGFLVAMTMMTSIASAQWIVFEEGTLGCKRSSDLERLINLSDQGDDEAERTLRHEFIENEECGWVRPSTEAYIEHRGSIDGLSCVRPRGETACLKVLTLSLPRRS